MAASVAPAPPPDRGMTARTAAAVTSQIAWGSAALSVRSIRSARSVQPPASAEPRALVSSTTGSRSSLGGRLPVHVDELGEDVADPLGAGEVADLARAGRGAIRRGVDCQVHTKGAVGRSRNVGAHHGFGRVDVRVIHGCAGSP